MEIIYAGGTISSLVTTDGYRIGGHALNLIGTLEERFPNFEPSFNLGRKKVAFTGLSENMDTSDWAAIDAVITAALSHKPQGVLITHGTDSMEQIAQHLRSKFLGTLWDNNQKLILTGANDDIEHPETDAWENLKFGLESAAGDAEPDVYVAYHGRLIRGDEVVKLPFVPGGELTFISKNDPLYKSSLSLQRQHASELISKLTAAHDTESSDRTVIEYNVNLIRQSHKRLLDHLAAHDTVRTILLTLYHSGTANTEKPDASVADLVRTLRAEKGIVFFGVTENGEPVDLHAYETSVKLREAGVVPLYNMLKEVALAKLRLQPPYQTPVQTIDQMLINKVGEIDESLIQKDDIAALKKLYSK